MHERHELHSRYIAIIQNTTESWNAKRATRNKNKYIQLQSSISCTKQYLGSSSFAAPAGAARSYLQMRDSRVCGRADTAGRGSNTEATRELQCAEFCWATRNRRRLCSRFPARESQASHRTRGCGPQAPRSDDEIDLAGGADDVVAVAGGLPRVTRTLTRDGYALAKAAAYACGGLVGAQTVAGDAVTPKSAVALGATEDSKSLP